MNAKKRPLSLLSMRTALIVALVGTLCAVASLFSAPQIARADDGICGYAYLEQWSAYSEGSYSLVIEKDKRTDTSSYIELGAVLDDYANSDAQSSTGQEALPWADYADRIKSVSVREGVNPKSMRGWFLGCAISSVDFSGLDASRVVDMARLFYSCKSLTSLELSLPDTANLIDTSEMFYNCSNLKSMRFTAFDTSSIINMSRMFSNCSSLTEAVFPLLNAPNATTLSSMFYGCSKLKKVSLPSLDTSNVVNMSYMFMSCSALTSIDLANFNTQSLENMSGMFSGCSSLTSLDLSSFQGSMVSDISGAFRNCKSLASLDLGSFEGSRVSKASNAFQNCESLTSLDLSSFDTSSISATETSNVFASAFAQGALLKLGPKAVFKNSNDSSVWKHLDDGWVYSEFPLEAGTFQKVGSLPTTGSSTHGALRFAILDAQGTLRLRTVSTASLPEKTEGCEAFVATNTTDEKSVPWHERRKDIKAVVFEAVDEAAIVGAVDSTGFPTSMAYWFADCPSLTSVDLSGLDTSKVTDFTGLFRNCSALETLDLSTMNTKKATSMRRMLHGCESLRQVKLGGNFTFRGTTFNRLPGTEMPSGAWQAEGDEGHAYAADSLPSFADKTFTKVDENTVGLTVESIRGETNTGNAKYTVKSTVVEGADGQLEELVDYTIADSYDSDTFTVGSTTKASSTKTLAAEKVTLQTVNRVTTGNSRVTKIEIGSQVKAISPDAFSGSGNVTSVAIKSMHLQTRASMQHCFRGSSVKTAYIYGDSNSRPYKRVYNAFRKWAF